MTTYRLPIEIETLAEGGFLAKCPMLQGCHAEGSTLTEAIANLEDVARQLIELRLEDGLTLPQELQPFDPVNPILKGEILLAVP